MRAWVMVLLIFVMATPATAQGPIARAVAAQCPCPPDQRSNPCPDHQDHQRRTRQAGGGMDSPMKFYVGLGLVAAGTTFAAGAVTWKQQSDLSTAPPGSRLNLNLAPCNTDPNTTRMPIAECKVNQPLLWLGVGMQSAGTVLMLTGGRSTKAVGIYGNALQVRVRF